MEHPPQDYKRYALTEDGISPMVKVGTKQGDFIATSYEHDEFGATTEEPAMKVAMTQKRAKKLENFFQKEGILGYEFVVSYFDEVNQKQVVTSDQVKIASLRSQ